MKIRNGFVSNSSSSSFIVALPVMPQTEAELQEMLFGDEKFYPNPYIFGDRDKYGWCAEEVTATVFADFQKPEAVINRDAAVEVVENGYLDSADMPEYPSYDTRLSPENRMKEFDRYHEALTEANRKVVDEFLSKVPDGSVLVHVEYSDNDGQYFTALEHGPLFNKLQHLRVSHH